MRKLKLSMCGLSGIGLFVTMMCGVAQAQETGGEPDDHVEECGAWIHGGWDSEGTITWNVDGQGMPQASIDGAVERCIWIDPCTGTTKDDDVHPVTYTVTLDEIRTEENPNDPETTRQYRHVEYSAASQCGGSDSFVQSDHYLDDCIPGEDDGGALPLDEDGEAEVG